MPQPYKLPLSHRLLPWAVVAAIVGLAFWMGFSEPPRGLPAAIDANGNPLPVRP